MFQDLRSAILRAHGASSFPLFVALAVNAFGAGMFFPFAMLYYQAVTALPVATIGVTLTSATLATLAVGPVTGVLVDRYGARPLVVGSQCLEAAGFAAFLAVSTAGTLLAAALVATAGARMFYASCSALIADMTTGQERDRWYGLVGITQSAGASLSGLMASVMLGAIGMDGFRVIIGTTAACFLGTAVLIHRLRGVQPRVQGGPLPASQGYRTILRDTTFLAIVGSNFLFVLCSMVMGIGLVVYATEAMRVPLWSLGAIGLLQTALTVGLQVRVTHRFAGIRRTRAMTFAGVLWVIACLGLAAGTLVAEGAAIPYLLVMACIFTIGTLCYVPASRALAAGRGPTHSQGRSIALYELSWGLAAAAAPATFGVLYGTAPSLPWVVMSLAVVAAIGVLLVAERRLPAWQNFPAATPPPAGKPPATLSRSSTPQDT